MTICGHNWFYCFIWRNRCWNRIQCLWRLTAGMLLVEHSSMSGSTNLKVVILMWETKSAEDHRKSLKMPNRKHCWMKMMVKRRTIECWPVNRFRAPQSHWKDFKVWEMGAAWADSRGQDNAACQIQKKVVFASNHHWWWKMDIFIES